MKAIKSKIFKLLTVWMKHSRYKPHRWWLIWVIFQKLKSQLKCPWKQTTILSRLQENQKKDTFACDEMGSEKIIISRKPIFRDNFHMNFPKQIKMPIELDFPYSSVQFGPKKRPRSCADALFCVGNLIISSNQRISRDSMNFFRILFSIIYEILVTRKYKNRFVFNEKYVRRKSIGSPCDHRSEIERFWIQLGSLHLHNTLPLIVMRII